MITFKKKNISILTLILLLSMSAFAKNDLSSNTYCRKYHETDSLTLKVYVSFIVYENGKVGKPKIIKTECIEYNIKKVDKNIIKEFHEEVLRIINETNDFKPNGKRIKYTQPIIVRLPIDTFLEKNK